MYPHLQQTSDNWSYHMSSNNIITAIYETALTLTEALTWNESFPKKLFSQKAPPQVFSEYTFASVSNFMVRFSIMTRDSSIKGRSSASLVILIWSTVRHSLFFKLTYLLKPPLEKQRLSYRLYENKNEHRLVGFLSTTVFFCEKGKGKRNAEMGRNLG